MTGGLAPVSPSDDRMRDEVRETVERFVRRLAKEPVSRRVTAVVVSGSAARGEDRGRGSRAGSDIDVMVITKSRSPLVGIAIERILSTYGASGMEGGQVPLKTLSSHATIRNYEAFSNGVVVAGDPNVLEAVAVQTPAAIPIWEAVRLLLNRAFEHVKLQAGTSEESTCVAKTYEAIGEAALVLSGRYRPSFSARKEEVEDRGIAPIVPRLDSKYAATFRRRFLGDQSSIAHVEEAADDLQLALAEVICAYLGRSADPEAAFDLIADRHRHLDQRLFWTIRRAFVDSDLRLAYLRRDPCLIIWREGLQCVRSRCPRADARSLVDQWRRCPQTVEHVRRD